METTIAQRIKILLRTLDIKQADLGKKAGLERQLISRTLNGTTEPTFRTIAALLKAVPTLNARWLILEEQPMFAGNNEDSQVMNEEGAKYQPACKHCVDKDKLIKTLTEFNELLKEDLDHIKKHYKTSVEMPKKRAAG